MANGISRLKSSLSWGIFFHFAFFSVAYAQQPTIKSINKVAGGTGQVVAITGSNFGTDNTKVVVHFGGARGSIQTLTDQLMEVAVPAGTTFDNITVTNLTSGLFAESRPSFLLTFDGPDTFDVNRLEGKKDFDAGIGLEDLCLCDFNADGKLDVATTAGNNITVHQNTSTGLGLANITFGKLTFPVPLATLQIKCGDLDGDGRPDIVATDNGNASDRIFVLVNKSSGSISFDPAVNIQVSGNSTKTLDIGDLDLDGKAELVITDQGSSGSRVSILQNVLGAMVRTDIAIPGAVTTDGIAVEDVNGDLRPEIITSQFNVGSSNMFVLENKSIPGGLSFTPLTFTVSTAVKHIKVGDLDGDGKPDIAFTQLISGSVGVMRNTTTGSISFATPVGFAAETGPWGLDFGDIDGNGQADIVVAARGSQNLTILLNKSAPGTLSFTKQSKNTLGFTDHVRVGDLDNDGKPDIAFTSTDPNFAIFRNSTCIQPVITPETTPVRICAGGDPYRLTASVSRGSFYEWKKDGTTISCGLNQNTFDVTGVTGSGNYTVVIRAEGTDCATANAAGCALESDPVQVIVDAGGSVTPVGPANDGPVCVGSKLNFSITSPIGGATYNWRGPNGFTATGTNPSINSFTLANAGRYYVDVVIGTCLSGTESTVVEVIDVPTIQVGFVGSPVICQGDPSKTLSIVPVPAGFTFQWKKDGVNIGGATSSSYAVTSVPGSTGAYSVAASYAGCTNVETPAVLITVAVPPTASFSIPATACANQQVTFTNQSTIPPSSPAVNYLWDFKDGQTSTDENPKHIYATAAGYSPTLTVSYANGACADIDTQPITITPAPSASITNPENKYKFCPGETLKLEVLGSFTSYTWSTGATTQSIDVTEGGEYTVDLGTTVGCVLTAVRTVETFPEPDVLVTAEPAQIDEGQTSQLTASGLINYTWSPPDFLNDPNIAAPIATPLQTTVFTVEGLDANGCSGSGTIEVKVKGEVVVNKLDPKSLISPNGDESNPVWVIGEIENYPQCNVAIYDDKGVKVFEAKPYLNNWDGTFNGKPLPDGVYYYIIRCDGEESSPRKGSITVLR